MCRACQFQSRSQKNNKLYSILIGEPWKRIGIDIVELLSVTKRGNRYIVTCINYMMKWAEVKLLPNKLTMQVVWFIYEEIIYKYICLAIINQIMN